MPVKKNFTIEDLKKSKVASINTHLFETPKEGQKVKKHKYGASKTEVNGIVFDSKKEANRYKELLLLLKAGEIGFLKTQVPFELNNNGMFSFKYIADFVYIDALTGQTIVEDVKGFKTKEYLKKRKLMFKIHGIKIIEI